MDTGGRGHCWKDNEPGPLPVPLLYLCDDVALH